MTQQPVELAVTDVLHRAAAGGSVPELLDGVVQAGLRAADPAVVRTAVVLGNPDGGLSVRASATPSGPSTDFASAQVSDELVLTGPALTAARTGAATAVHDTAAGTSTRWPRWVELAGGAGVRGARCWPVLVGNVPVGALVFLSSAVLDPAASTASDPGVPAASARYGILGQSLSDVCSVVLQLPSVDQRWAQALVALRTTVDGSVTVHQAVGMIAAAHGVDVSAAATALATHAEIRGQAPEVLARRLVTREVPASDVRPAPRSPRA